MATPKWIQDHIDLYKTDPEKALWWDSARGGGKGLLKTLLLTTTGRKSGNAIATPLIFDKAGEAYVVIASKGGAPDHPDWYKNMVAKPEAEIQVGRERHHVRMRVAAGAERAQLWARMTDLYPPYDDYQKTAGAREIPVVVLEPTAS